MNDINITINFGEKTPSKEASEMLASLFSQLKEIVRESDGKIGLTHERPPSAAVPASAPSPTLDELYPPLPPQLTNCGRTPQKFGRRDVILKRYLVNHVRRLRDLGPDAVYVRPTKAEILAHFEKRYPAYVPTNLARDVWALTHEGRRFDPLFLFLWEGCGNPKVIEFATQKNAIASIMRLTKAAEVEYQLRLLRT